MKHKMDARILFLLSRAGYVLKNHVKRELEKEGLRFAPVEMGVLFSLELTDGLQMNEIAHIVQADGAAITRYVDRLEGNGLVQRNPSPEDRRKIHIRITQEGRHAATRCKTVVRRINNAIIDGFEPQEIQGFVNVLNGLLTKSGSDLGGS